MPQISNVILLVFIIVSVVLLIIARKAKTIEKRPLSRHIILNNFNRHDVIGQWKKPQDFYIKYESAGIPKELEGLKEEQAYIEHLKTEWLCSLI